MSEDITDLPPVPWPVVEMTQTLDTNFAAHYDTDRPQNGLPWELFPHPAFPWLGRGSENTTDTSDGRSVLFIAPSDDGESGLLHVTPQEPFRQTNINGEMSCILWPVDWARIGVPDLVYLEREDDVTFARFASVPTPDASLDECRAVHNNFKVADFDVGASTITLEGQGYYRQRPSSALNADGSPVYDTGPHMGLHRFDRDQLTSDVERALDSFKRHEHRFLSFQLGARYVIVERIEDFPVHDARNGPHPSDYNASGLKPEAERRYPYDTNARSTHVLHVPAGVPSELKRGDVLTMHRRLPYCSAMLTTASTFSQKYGVWDIRLRLERKTEQFSSIFLWSHYLESAVRRYPGPDKEVEIDVPEYPGGTLLFSNVHRPSGERDGAPTENRMDVLGWSKIARDENRLAPEAAAAAGLDFTDWFDIRTVFWPPGNEAGKPANWCERYLRMADGTFTFLCGEAMSPDAHSGVLDNLQLFLCNPVGGNFVSGAVFGYASRHAPSGPDADEFPILMDVAHVKVFQLPGQLAGGAGLPAPNGSYPRGLVRSPTQGLIPGNGSGLIPGGGAGPVDPIDPTDPTNPTDPTTPTDPGTPPITVTTGTTVDGYVAVGRRDDGGGLLLPEGT